MCVVGLILTCGILAWTNQIFYGMGEAGKRTPQMWAMYITTFVFWIGIGHAGTLISAILYLFRARWRTSIYRAAEAMTIFAVMTAGLFPLIHAGRMWFAYFLLPYPNQRYLWPNFRSPLVWDVFAISTYLSISTVFFIVGLVPDIAALRDASSGWRRRIYAMLALGWEGADTQWRHYRRAYGLLASLATPLVLSVHSVVSWDFAMALVPGWHSTLFAPFFVDGALWTMYFCNCVAPLVLFWRRARTSPVVLYIVSILVLIGMWFERFNIIVPSLGHDFYPYTWGIYYPSPTDTMIVIGSFSFFLLLFLGFIKLIPSLSIVVFK